MLTASGRAPLFGDPGKGATAAGADVGVGAQSANILAGGSDGELDTEITEVEQSDQAHDAAQFSARKRVRHGADRGVTDSVASDIAPCECGPRTTSTAKPRPAVPGGAWVAEVSCRSSDGRETR